MLITDGGYNEVGYPNASYDRLVGTDSSDPQKRWDNMVEAERILLEEDVVLAPLYQRTGIVLQKPDVTNIIEHDFGPDFSFKWVQSADGQLNLLDSTAIPTLDTNLATDSVSFNALNQYAEGLVRLGQTGSDVVSGVAETWSNEGLVYTFNLRTDAVWVDHTGAEIGNVVAGDFVYGWNRLTTLDGAQYSYMLADTAHISSFVATDDYTLVVTLDSDTPWFLSLMTFPSFYPVNQESVELHGDLYGTSNDTTAYNGAFYLSSWTPNETRLFTKNDSYWDAAVVELQTINYRVISGVENETAVTMYFDGDIDRTGLSGERVDLYKNHDEARPTMSPVIFYLMFNQGHEGFAE